jgi:hypothetical protein
MGRTEQLVGTGAFICMSIGFGLAWLPLGMIVPGGIVFGALVWKHFRAAGPSEPHGGDE